jgi:hypothetical protein
LRHAYRVFRRHHAPFALLAVDSCARTSARERDSGQLSWLDELRERREAFVDQVRSWVGKANEVEEPLRVVLDSFVRRVDHQLVRELDRSLNGAPSEEAARREIWMRFDAAGSLEHKRAFVSQIQAQGVERLGSVSERAKGRGGGPDMGR